MAPAPRTVVLGENARRLRVDVRCESCYPRSHPCNADEIGEDSPHLF